MSSLNNDLCLRDLEKRVRAIEDELFGPPDPDPDMVAKFRADIARKVLMGLEEEAPKCREQL